MLHGRYRDVLTDAGGERALVTPWRSNLVLDGAFPLLATLLKREPEAEGIRYWAVGAGDESWDTSAPAPSSRRLTLTDEVLRLAVPREAIGYIDQRGAESPLPTPDLEVTLTFEGAAETITLREFGIFGGDADAQPNTGILINHVVHPRIDLEPGQRLRRELRLSFLRRMERRWVDLPTIWLSNSAARVVDGVGVRFAEVLADLGITTVSELAQVDPNAPPAGDAPRLPLLELRSKARLALRTLAEVHPPAGLHELRVSEILSISALELALATGIPEAEAVRLWEQLATLELALDQRFLGRLTVGQLGAAEP